MLHDELIVGPRVSHPQSNRFRLTRRVQAHLWTVCYFSGASLTPALGQRWLGPDPSLGGLRLWERGLSMTEALKGTTTRDESLCIGIVPAATRRTVARL